MRTVLAFLGFFSVIFLSSWAALVVIVVLSLRYRAWEAIAIGLFADMLWHAHGIPYFMIAAIAIVWMLEPVRMRLLS